MNTIQKSPPTSLEHRLTDQLANERSYHEDQIEIIDRNLARIAMIYGNQLHFEFEEPLDAA